jgi:hypothetical protein
MASRDKLHHFMTLGLLKLTREMLQQSDPCEIMNQQFEEAAEEVFEEEWIEERQVSATVTSDAARCIRSSRES